MDFEVIAEGLQFPEGPIVMPDGSIVLVEIARGTLSRVWNGRTEVIGTLQLDFNAGDRLLVRVENSMSFSSLVIEA